MKCYKCGYSNEDDALYCRNCGSRLQLECPNCHKSLHADSKFCSYCGSRINNDLKDLTQEEPVKQPVTENANINAKTEIVKPNISQTAKLENGKKINVLFFLAIFFWFVGLVSLSACFFTAGKYKQEDVIGWFVVFFISTVTGLVLYKPELMKKPKNIGKTLIGAGVAIFLFGLICSGRTRYGFRADYIEWGDFAVNFFVGCLFATVGLFLVFNKPSSESVPNPETESITNITASEKTEDLLEAQTVENNQSTEPQIKKPRARYKTGSLIMGILSVISFFYGIFEYSTYQELPFILDIIIPLVVIILCVKCNETGKKSYGMWVIAIQTVMLIMSLIGAYNYNNSYYSYIEMSYGAIVFGYCIRLIPSIMMCQVPLLSEDQSIE